MRRSRSDSEVMAFTDGSDEAYFIKQDLPLVTNLYILQCTMTDGLSLVVVLRKEAPMTGKCLKIDLGSVQNFYKNGGIHDVAFIPS